MKIQSITIDSTLTKSELCELGAGYGTDKSPYNKISHRHPYTAVYSLLLSRFRDQPVRFVEIGIAGGASVAMWGMYFKNPNKNLFFFDRDENFIRQAASFHIPDTHCLEMDVTKEDSIVSGLRAIGGDLDILLDDSTHGILEQVKIIKMGLPYVKPGGMIIVEDIFKRTPEEEYQNALADVLDEFSFATFIVCDHKDRWSPDWDNDKLLVLVKK
jgi:hypothetical protein